MADLSITAANVQQSAAAAIVTGIAGVAIVAGEALFIDTADENLLKLADCTDIAKTNVAGIALNDAAVGQPVSYALEDAELVIGATVAIGDIVVLSEAGAISLAADLVSGDETVIIGVGVSTTEISVNFRGTELPIRAGAVAA